MITIFINGDNKTKEGQIVKTNITSPIKVKVIIEEVTNNKNNTFLQLKEKEILDQLAELQKEKKELGFEGILNIGINNFTYLTDEEIEMTGGDILPPEIPRLTNRGIIQPSKEFESELKFVGKIQLKNDKGEPINVSCDDYVFDIRDKWPECKEIINNIRHQSLCKDCWAVASSSALSDRRCIEMIKNDIKIPEISDTFFDSAYQTAACSNSLFADGCKGGKAGDAWKFFEKDGVVSGNNYNEGGCIPYPFEPIDGHELPQFGPKPKQQTAYHDKCTDICLDNYKNDKRKATNISSLFVNNLPKGEKTLEKIMKEQILNNGTIVAAFELYDDFTKYYKSGIYIHLGSNCSSHTSYPNKKHECFGHAVRLIGYGNLTCSNGNFYKYWLGINSLGNKWGNDGGFFKIARGIDEVNIETRQISFGTPIINDFI